MDFLQRNGIESYSREHVWIDFRKVLLSEHKKNTLQQNDLRNAFGRHIDSLNEMLEYLEEEQETDFVLDTIEIFFQAIANIEKFMHWPGNEFQQYPHKEAIDDLNTRFAENCLGYKFDNNFIIRIDNELLYQEITKPLLSLINQPEYQNINDEYMLALQHFRNQNYPDCITNCGKSFESTMKIICEKKGYSYKQNYTSFKLLEVIFNNNYIPSYIQSELQSLRAVLESGVNVLRNKTAHGSGVDKLDISIELASFALNLTGSTISFLLSLIDKK